MNMRIRVDKDYTDKAFTDQVKADIAEFKERYTIGDVLNSFRCQVDRWDGWTQEIIKVDAKAFPGGYYYDNATHFCFEFLIDGASTMYKIRFYIDMDLIVDTRTGLYSIKKYVLA